MRARTFVLLMVPVLLLAGTLTSAHAQHSVQARACSMAHQGAPFTVWCVENTNGTLTTYGDAQTPTSGGAPTTPGATGVTAESGVPGSQASLLSTSSVDLATGAIKLKVSSVGVPARGLPEGRWSETVTLVNVTGHPVELPIQWRVDGVLAPNTQGVLDVASVNVNANLTLSGIDASTPSPTLRGYPSLDMLKIWIEQGTVVRASGPWGTVAYGAMAGDWVFEPFGALGARLRGALVVPAGTSRFRVDAHVGLDCNNGTQCDFSDTALFGLGPLPAGVTLGSSSGVFVAEQTNPAGDTDGDGLSNDFETRFGLDPFSAIGDAGADGDPDGDGLTNAQEAAGGTHPNGSTVRYLAEGATGALFDTRLALLNPSHVPAHVLMRFLKGDGTIVPHALSLAPRTRATVDVETVPGMAAAEFSTVIEADQLVTVDRTMTWDDAGYGAHADTAVASPSAQWFLAEGSTNAGFALFYLLQNPSSTDTATVRVRYLLPTGAPLEKSYTLAPATRFNIWVNEEEFTGKGKALAATDVSAVIDVLAGPPIIVERAMYANVPGQFFGAGHQSAGVSAPATQWFLAEGATGPYFDLFVLIANPTATDADVEATFLLPDGSTIVQTHKVTANSRFNIWVDKAAAALADTAVSTTIRTTNGVPVIVERAMWWPGSFGQWHEAHNSAGATATGTAWAVAEGEVGGTRGVETYLLIANTSATAATVSVTLLFEDGTSATRTFTGSDIPARSRFNVAVGAMFPEAAHRRFGALVESIGATPAQIVVERAMYWDAAGQRWAAGTNALATRLP